DLVKDCLGSLAFQDIYYREAAIGFAAQGTGEWLLHHTAYQDWLASDRGLLWILGKPASGKSTLMKQALYSFGSNHGLTNDIILSFFFHARGSSLSRSHLGLFRSLIFQLLRRFPVAQSDLVDEFDRRRNSKGTQGEMWNWHISELRDFFELSLPRVLERYSIRLFIDALDECDKRDDIVDLIGYFNSLLQRLPPTPFQLSICFSCRHYPLLPVDYGSTICLEDENRDDIYTYVNNRLSKAGITSKSEMVSTIMARAGGVFLWAVLTVEHIVTLLENGYSAMAITNRIQPTPTDLDNLYERIIDSTEERPASIKLMEWICFATRPLKLIEVQWAMMIDDGYQYNSLEEVYSKGDYFGDIHVMKKRVTDLTHGLAEVILSSDSHVVQFIHSTVKDFFIRKGLSAFGLFISESGPSLSPDSARFLNRSVCIRYFRMREIQLAVQHDNPHDALSRFDFLNYATTSWVAHATQSADGGVSQGDLLEYFNWPSEDLVELWVRICRSIDHSKSTNRPSGGSQLIHILSINRLIEPLSIMLQRQGELGIVHDQQDDLGRTALSLAAENGHEDVVKLLLEYGAYINSMDYNGRTPLFYSTKSRHE
ncbi:hypothetical protein BGZ57DRAFT_978726, partial [Hyaloscypha finlandica]